MENGKAQPVDVAPGNGHLVWLPLPEEMDVQYALLMRNLPGTTTRDPHGAVLAKEVT